MFQFGQSNSGAPVTFQMPQFVPESSTPSSQPPVSNASPVPLYSQPSQAPTSGGSQPPQAPISGGQPAQSNGQPPASGEVQNGQPGVSSGQAVSSGYFVPQYTGYPTPSKPVDASEL